MVRVGTRLDQHGRPEDRVQIIRRGKNTTRIRRSTNYGRSWAAEDERVDTNRILEDGGKRFGQHSHNPKHATYLTSLGEPQARLQAQRVYAHTTKARAYLGDNTWSELEDFSTRSILFDGGASYGWHPPTDHADPEDEVPDDKQDATPQMRRPLLPETSRLSQRRRWGSGCPTSGSRVWTRISPANAR